MTPTASTTESFVSPEESLAREHTERMIGLIDEAYESIDPKDDIKLLAHRICNYLEDVESGLKDDINPIRVVQPLHDQDLGPEWEHLGEIGLGLLIEISKEETDPNLLKEYKQSSKYVDNLEQVLCDKPKIVFTQDDESSITTILAVPFLAEDILLNVDITDERRRDILRWLYYVIKRRKEEKEQK
jgi:hypothetical protein